MRGGRPLCGACWWGGVHSAPCGGWVGVGTGAPVPDPAAGGVGGGRHPHTPGPQLFSHRERLVCRLPLWPWSPPVLLLTPPYHPPPPSREGLTHLTGNSAGKSRAVGGEGERECKSRSEGISPEGKRCGQESVELLLGWGAQGSLYDSRPRLYLPGIFPNGKAQNGPMGLRSWRARRVKVELRGGQAAREGRFLVVSTSWHLSPP